MQLSLELLAPARNADIGIAAIDCGADAVYIAGPAFGARAAAGNPVEDIARLCRYAHRYGAKVHATVNTLLQGGEPEQARMLMWELYEAGVDVFIIQDLKLLSLELPPVELHASTQTAVRTPERARELERLGFSRLVLERQLSLDEIRAIRAAVPASCGLEFFIHGALCVGYSGQCYLSQHLTGRSANRGVCAQACRSRYDLVDAGGRVLVRDRALLSPKDLRFDRHVAALVEAGITSFKIEGRLKNASYVKNVVRHYRKVIDDFIAAAGTRGQVGGDMMPGLTGHLYRKASRGRLEGGFTPDPDKTFSRGWTDAFLCGHKEKLASEDAAKSLGEYVGQIVSVGKRMIEIQSDKQLSNGDGLSFVGRSSTVTGQRVEVAQGNRITLRDTAGLEAGMRIYRNYDIRFERELENNMPRRVLDVSLTWRSAGPSVSCPARPGISPASETTVIAVTEDGIRVEKRFQDDAPVAEKPDAALATLHRQLGKRTAPFAFALQDIQAEPVRFYPASFLNGLRRELANALLEKMEKRPRREVPHVPVPGAGALNRSSLEVPGELMRSRYCIRWELGLCPKQHPPRPPKEPLFLVNQKNRLRLVFDCARCEMGVVVDSSLRSDPTVRV